MTYRFDTSALVPEEEIYRVDAKVMGAYAEVAGYGPDDVIFFGHPTTVENIIRAAQGDTEKAAMDVLHYWTPKPYQRLVQRLLAAQGGGNGLPAADPVHGFGRDGDVSSGVPAGALRRANLVKPGGRRYQGAMVAPDVAVRAGTSVRG